MLPSRARVPSWPCPLESAAWANPPDPCSAPDWNEGTLVMRSAVTSRRPPGLVLQASDPVVGKERLHSLWALTAQHLHGVSSQMFGLLPFPVRLF